MSELDQLNYGGAYWSLLFYIRDGGGGGTREFLRNTLCPRSPIAGHAAVISETRGKLWASLFYVTVPTFLCKMQSLRAF
jgi:hypothetical protein